jgi:hypothetical protein
MSALLKLFGIYPSMYVLKKSKGAEKITVFSKSQKMI